MKVAACCATAEHSSVTLVDLDVESIALPNTHAGLPTNMTNSNGPTLRSSRDKTGSKTEPKVTYISRFLDSGTHFFTKCVSFFEFGLETK